jgi:tetratricopeptide (TPR) repeat protein
VVRSIISTHLLLGVFALGMICATSGAAAAAPVRSDGRTRLDLRARELLDRFAAARTGAGGGYSDALADDLIALADSLEQARSDSLAWKCHRGAAALLARRGRGEEAAARNEHALRVALATGSPAMILRSRIALADSYRTAGRVEEAIATARSAVLDAVRAGDSLNVAEASNSLASSCLSIGRQGEAGEAYDRALAAARANRDAPNTIEALGGLAQYLHFCERNGEALVHADSAVALAQRAGNPHNRAVCYNVRSIILSALANQPAALADIDSACAIDRRSGNLRHLVQSRTSRARVYQRMGLTDACLAETDSLLAMASVREEDFRTRLLSLRGIALIEARRFAEAESLLLSTVGLAEHRRRELAEESSRAAAFYYGGQAHTTLARCYLEQGRIEPAWHALQRGRAAVLREHMEPSPACDPTLELTRLQRELLRANAAIVQYNDASRNPMVAFVLTGDSLEVVSLGIARHGADAETAIQLLSSGAPDSLCRAVLGRVARDIVSEVVARIPENVTRLYIAPPSDLTGFPFEELPIRPGPDPARPPEGDATPTTLGDRYAVTYLPNADLLLVLLDRACAAGGMMLVADATLPATKQEVRRLAVSGARRFQGQEASKARLIETLSADPCAVLHFATHATIDAVHPERSALRLGTKDFDLTTAQIESLALAADLVTLSGCRTSGGHTYISEGTLGLPRAFLIAGARSVVSSLWDVEDRAAMQFMTFFYAKLRDGLPRDECLQAARADMRRAGYSTRDRAAFVLTGVGHLPVTSLAGATVPPRPGPYAWGTGAVMLLALIGWLTRHFTAGSGRGRSRG